MADGISAGLIEAVQRRIYEALAQTAAGSLLTEEEQDRLLAQACAESCAVLGSWLDAVRERLQRGPEVQSPRS